MITTAKRWITLGSLLLACVSTQWGCMKAMDHSAAAFVTYEVPAISSVMRLPQTQPTDGTPGSDLHIVAAKGEYEPASFVITPFEDLAGVQLTATDLKGPGGTIPASSVDLRVVKVWYQGGTAWYSYFGDSSRRQLVPELLLHDETLIKVDTDHRENYLRVGKEYQSVSYPGNDRPAFNYMTEPVADSLTLQPISLTQGQNKQIWVTVLVPRTAREGLYTGKINMVVGGRTLQAMTLNLRVLPFELPKPKTYYNLNNPFLVSLYGTGMDDTFKALDVPLEEQDRFQMLYMKNLLSHNVFNYRNSASLSYKKDRQEAIKVVKREVEMMKKAGFDMKPLLTSGWGYWDNIDQDNMALFQERMDDLAKALKEAAGHDDIYLTSYDEANVARIKTMRSLLEYAQSIGIKVWLTTRAGHHFDLEGYLINYANHGGWPKKEYADKWHAIGSKVASYAGPHSGPENPVVFRRFEGLTRYKAKYDGSFNYKYMNQLGGKPEKSTANVWNDFQGNAFRRFNFVYPTKEGPIDTLAWEGFREGIDDIRYATLLKQEAAAAIASSNVEAGFVAKKALIWLELLDDEHADLNMARLEMIDHILKIRKIMGK